ncbi:hypothetical protein [Paraliomyxa miuraensis]|uniref:hypothetical protein n=1 Tax=Paraliomyxa miuraensis TaxID=376150 RepID=UPI00225113C1|nr:hypothetical protein [Paraliomyxa miuraensis]MCX4241814.1 hypothetical protein [Paraliomyxa miuraensis]
MSPIVDNLRIDAEIPPQGIEPGASVVVSLRFLNLDVRARKLFFIRAEPFRFGQSTLTLDRGGSGPPIVSPPPRPHGYVVTEADFHDIAPRSRLAFSQALRVPADLLPGTYGVRWVYENEITQWKGGVNTLDGPSEVLFDGKPIEGIWVGSLEDRFSITVRR